MIALRRMRCLLCRRPWAETPAVPADLPCPFCGCDRTIDSADVLARAFPTPTERRRSWLFAERSAV